VAKKADESRKEMGQQLIEMNGGIDCEMITYSVEWTVHLCHLAHQANTHESLMTLRRVKMNLLAPASTSFALKFRLIKVRVPDPHDGCPVGHQIDDSVAALGRVMRGIICRRLVLGGVIKSVADSRKWMIDFVF
jgi:hypothetical protein